MNREVTPSTAGLPSRSMSSEWRGVLSPFGMGEAWYIEAARQFCTSLDCCLVAPVLANEIIESPDASWRNFRNSHLYNWAHSQELSPTSKFQENIKEWLGSYEKSFGERHGDRRFKVHKGLWNPELWDVSANKNFDRENRTVMDNHAFSAITQFGL
ncbi:uncharacterized protein EAE97_008042 [Botrytis byssoidea]|uniref:Uncharacterized protein n=1 Tax=Botrytis byssoidea TaxID=139641 RepID=A0A9P5II56_9HELO|nr:uncharacterized protein EAE97_008042 [Botrytis byssoidea]KAF7936676.1 hypothetical protein EAE97_008042 [Botrytis byssoidea]